MPSFFHVMVGLSGTALAAAVAFLWLHEPQHPPSRSDTFPSSPRMVGKSALSHGGSTPTGNLTAVPSPTQFQIGQKVIVAAEEHASRPVSLLPSPPDSVTSTSTPGAPRTLSSGTVVIVSGMRATDLLSGRAEQYYEVTVPDGGKGWLSERVLQLATNEN